MQRPLCASTAMLGTGGEQPEIRSFEVSTNSILSAVRCTHKKKKLTEIYAKLDGFAFKDLGDKNKTQRASAKRVDIGNKKPGIPECKKRVFPFMVDDLWLDTDRDGKRKKWTKLTNANPPGF